MPITSTSFPLLFALENKIRDWRASGIKLNRATNFETNPNYSKRRRKIKPVKQHYLPNPNCALECRKRMNCVQMSTDTHTHTTHSDTLRIRIYVHFIPFNSRTQRRQKINISLKGGNIKRIIVTKLVINFQLISSRRSVIFCLKFIPNALSWCSASSVAAPFLDFSIHFVYFFLFIHSFYFNIFLLANFVDESVSISHFWILGNAKS